MQFSQIARSKRMNTRLTDKIARALLNPVRDNDLERRRKALKLSRAALARIFGVNEATIFRQQSHGRRVKATVTRPRR